MTGGHPAPFPGDARPPPDHGAPRSVRGRAGRPPGFDVGGPVRSARLPLWVTGSSALGPQARVADAAWSESAVTWATRSAIGADAVARCGRVASGTWLELDVTAAVAAGGARALALVPAGDDSAFFAAREAGAATRPHLIVER